MSSFSYPTYPTENGYLTEKIRSQYLKKAVANKVLPENAHRMPAIVSLCAPNDISQPIQFWQLFSVLGQDRIVTLVQSFYKRVFAEEQWFSSVFARIGGVSHHVNTQASMWIDVMGGGAYYHGGEYRLSYHHTHNAIQLMNDKGAERWVSLMVETLNDPSADMTEDQRVRPCINTFLAYFLSRYADEFNFSPQIEFGKTNGSLKRKINFMTMTDDAIEALSEGELREALEARGVDVSKLADMSALVSKAQRL